MKCPKCNQRRVPWWGFGEAQTIAVIDFYIWDPGIDFTYKCLRCLNVWEEST